MLRHVGVSIEESDTRKKEKLENDVQKDKTSRKNSPATDKSQTKYSFPRVA